MTWLHAGLLAGLTALALPLLIHLLARARPRPVVFPALRLVQPHLARAARGWQVQRWLLLALRLAAVALLVLALAGPTCRTASTIGTADPVDVVLVLDDSASMGDRSAGESPWQRACAQAAALLDRLPPGSRAGLVTASAAAYGLEAGAGAGLVPLTVDLPRVQAALDALASQDHGEAVLPAVGLGGSWLADAAAPGRTRAGWLVVLSDFAPPAVGGPAPRLDPNLQVIWCDVASPAADRRGLSAVQWPSGLLSAGVATTISVQLEPQVEAGAAVRLEVDGTLAAQGLAGTGASSAAASTAAWTTLDLSTGPLAEGLHALCVRLEPTDGWPADNAAYAAVQVGARPVVALCGGDRAASQPADAVARLAAAVLAPAALSARQQRVALRWLAADDLAAGLAGADLLVLADVPALSARQAQAVQALAARGGHVLAIPGPRTQAQPAGPAAWPARWAAAEAGGPWRLRPAGGTDPWLAPFRTGRPNLAAPAFTRRHPLVDLADRAQTLVTFDDGRPALVRLGDGAGGSVAQLAFGPAPAEGDLAQTGRAGVWVVLLQRWVELCRPAASAVANVDVGQWVAWPPAAGAGRATSAPAEWTVVRPDGSRAALARSGRDGRFRVTQAGVYRLETGGQVGGLVAANVPAGEANRGRPPPERLQALGPADRTAVVSDLSAVTFIAPAERVGRQTWTAELGALLLVVLLVESWVASRSGRPAAA